MKVDYFSFINRFENVKKKKKKKKKKELNDDRYFFVMLDSCSAVLNASNFLPHARVYFCTFQCKKSSSSFNVRLKTIKWLIQLHFYQ